MEKVRTSLRDDTADCRAATVMAGRGPVLQKVACSPKAKCDVGPEQNWGRSISKGERGESDPISSNLNSLCSLITLS